MQQVYVCKEGYINKMNNKVSRLLKKRAFELSKTKESKLVGKEYKKKKMAVIKGKLKSFIVDLVTFRYDKESPKRIYRELKKKWNDTPRNKRRNK